MQLLYLLGIFLGYVLLALVVTLLLIKGVGALGGQMRTKQAISMLSAAVFVLIPTWDVIPGRLYFDHLCRTEAGLRVYKTVEGVEGFRIEGVSGLGGYQRKDFKDLGYGYIERTDIDNKRYRYLVGRDGGVTQQEVKEFFSRYAVRGIVSKPLAWNVTKSEDVVIDVQTQERLGESANFTYRGNWVTVGSYLGSHSLCPGVSSGSEYENLILKTLHPVHPPK